MQESNGRLVMATKDRMALRASALTVASAGTLFWVYTFYGIAQVPSGDGSGFQWLAVMPLGLVFLGPVIVNILLYHVFLNPEGLLMAVVVAVLWFIVFYAHRGAFAGIFAQRA